MNLKEFFRPVYVPVVNVYFKTFKAPKRYHHLVDEIRKNKVTSILEVGTWSGDRAVEMIKVAHKYAPNKKIRYTGFDLFEDLTDNLYMSELSKKPPTKKKVEEKLLQTGASVELVQGNTVETLPKYVMSSSKFDFIYIDGGHNAETIQSDWQAVSELMHENSVVIFDDYWRNREDQSAKPVVDRIDTQKYNVEVLPEIDVFENHNFGRLEISFAKVTRK